MKLFTEPVVGNNTGRKDCQNVARDDRNGRGVGADDRVERASTEHSARQRVAVADCYTPAMDTELAVDYRRYRDNRATLCPLGAAVLLSAASALAPTRRPAVPFVTY